MTGGPAGSQRRGPGDSGSTRPASGRLPRSSPEDALAAGLRYLAASSRSESMMKRRLLAAGFVEEAIESAVARLSAMGYIDDRALAKQFLLRAADDRPAGRRKLSRDLLKGGLTPQTVQGALEEFWDDALEARSLHRALESATRREKKADPGACRRVSSALLRRGFGQGAVYEVIRSWAAGRSQPADDGEENHEGE